MSTSVVIIGAGVRGTSIAYHLAKRGIRPIVVDKAGICAETSGASFALINVSGKTPANYTALSLASADLYPGLADELDADLEYERGTAISAIVETEEELPQAHAYAHQQSQVPGVSMQVLSRAEARELEPNLSPTIAGATYCPQDGYLSPFALTFAYARAAKRLGATFLTYRQVTGIRTNGDRVVGVDTDQGPIACEWVVNAAGIHVPVIGAMIGVDIPLRPNRGQVVTTEPLPGLLRRPIGHLRPNRAGPILIGTTREFVGPDRHVVPHTLAENIRRAIRILPALGTAKMLRAWAGLRPMPADGLPIIGSVPGMRGFLIATGHSGFTLGQITGATIAALITTGTMPAVVEPFQLARFDQPPAKEGDSSVA